MTGQELKEWREKSSLTQRELAAKLDVSDATLTRWENGQEIPGPAKKLLAILMYGEMPFEGSGPDRDKEKEVKNLWELQLTLFDWHKLEGLAAQAGYNDTKDYLLSIIQSHLRDQRKDSNVDTQADSVESHLDKAAQAFVEENSPPGSSKKTQNTSPAPPSKGKPSVKPLGI